MLIQGVMNVVGWGEDSYSFTNDEGSAWFKDELHELFDEDFGWWLVDKQTTIRSASSKLR